MSGRGVAPAQMTRPLAQLEGLSMIGTVCEDDLVPFSKGSGMRRGNAMLPCDDARRSGQPQG